MRRALAGLVIALTFAPAAWAGSAGTWTPVTQPYNENFGLVGLYRTADGVLHVTSRAGGGGGNPTDAIHAGVAPNGTVGPFTPIATGWNGMSASDVTANSGGGLAVMWGGTHSTTTGDPLNNGGIATSDDSGSAWTLSPASPWGGGTASADYVYAAQIGIVNAANVLYQGWFATTGTFVHRGVDPTVGGSNYQTQLGGYGSVPGFGVNAADGSLWFGWQTTFADANDGVWVQQVDQATGAPAGAPIKMPGSSVQYQGKTESQTILGRTPITGRPGKPGVFMAYSVGYPNATKVLVWKVGDPGPVMLVDTKTVNVRQVAIAADPDGRVVVVWGEDRGLTGKLFASVSDTNATSWGKPFEIPSLAKAPEQWAVQASAQSGALVDVVQNFSESNGSTMRFWHTQALAPPVLATTVNASVVSGTVLIQLPGTTGFAPLAHDSQIPVGTTVDTTNGRVRILAALPGGKTDASDFFQGTFLVTQGRNGLADMTLAGGNLKVCGKGAQAVAAKSTVIRQLWGAGKGKFRTKGRYAAASIRGTTWDTIDRCDGTLVKVTRGSVTVRDFKLKKNVVVTASHSYLAKR
jgi:hypothetical protein